MSSDDTGYYVYAVGEAAALTDLGDLRGIDDAPVTREVHGPLCGLASAVDLAAFRDAQQAGGVSETSWLAGAVRAHERVALHALRCAPVLPMRFGTVYAHADDIGAMLRRHQASLTAELHRLAGCTEWCLKVQLDDAGERRETVAAVADAPASGTAWLLSRQAALHARNEHGDRLSECVETLREAVAPAVRDIVVSRPAGGRTDVIRMWLLVDDVQRLHAAFDGARARHSTAGFGMELTGPWPAYHFVRTDALRDDLNASRDHPSALRDGTSALGGNTSALRGNTSDGTSALRGNATEVSR